MTFLTQTRTLQVMSSFPGSVERLPHDRSDLLWSGGSPTKLLVESADRWGSAMVADDCYNRRSETRGQGEAVVIAKSSGVICGLLVVERLLSKHYPSCTIEWNIEEGDSIGEGARILTIRGECGEILQSERVMLNILGRLSGIATNTASWVSAAGNIDVASTRKTGWGLLDKWAVHVGGGLTHRLNRCDALMLKENDISAMSKEGEEPPDAIARIVSGLSSDSDSFTTVEVRDSHEALAAARAWSQERGDRVVIMLDNMGPASAVEVVSYLSEEGLRERCILEGSGGVVLESLSDWSDSGVDLVSSSGLNLGVAPVDFSLIIGGGEFGRSP